ncbi:unnamed protein product [Tuber aestivum]|uniref:DNA repair protein RAD51 homolog 3 n=1 Tax=Tuber aestivum TaxID=59557 RepID=A0A292PQS5_9PEZI|nr:unnamed protein product [Tuber aestivum]
MAPASPMLSSSRMYWSGSSPVGELKIYVDHVIDRLPTLSASQALSASQSTDSRISTGSGELDMAIGGGLSRGKITELCGPPGSGKTTVGLQSAANALLSGDGNRVVWIDTSHPLPVSRLGAMLSRSGDPRELFPNLQTIRAPTLAHLLALVVHPLPTFPPENTTLVVIDNVSTPFTAAFPPGMEDEGAGGGGRGKKEPVGVRRFAIMGDLISALGKLAGSKGVAVCTTIKPNDNKGYTWSRGDAHTLCQLVHPSYYPPPTIQYAPTILITTPTTGSPTWITSLNSRLLIHYNKTSPSLLANPDDSLVSQIRYVTILKSNGVLHSSDSSWPVKLLQIQETGVDDVRLISEASPAAPVMGAYTRRKKRKRGLEAGVIPGSDEEGDGESEENEEAGLAGDMYQWEEGAGGDDVGAVVKCSAQDSREGQEFTKFGVNGEQGAAN